MKGSEIDDPGHLIGLKPRRFPHLGSSPTANQDLSTMLTARILQHR